MRLYNAKHSMAEQTAIATQWVCLSSLLNTALGNTSAPMPTDIRKSLQAAAGKAMHEFAPLAMTIELMTALVFADDCAPYHKEQNDM